MLRMRPLLIVLLVTGTVAGWLASVAPAESGETRRGTLVASPRFVPAAGPVLAGDDRLAWVSRRDDRVLDLWVLEIGGSPRRVQRYSGSDDERLRPVRLIASQSRIGLQLSVTENGRARPRAYAGAFGAPLQPVGSLQIDGADGAKPDAQREQHGDESAGRAVWVARGCGSAEIRTIALPAPALVAQRERRCRLRLRRAVTLRRGRLKLGISCAGFAIDCSAHVTVRAGGRLIARGDARYTHSTPPFAAADMRLTARGARLLRRRPHTRLRISARYGASEPVRHTIRTVTRS